MQVGRHGVHKTMITLTREEAQSVLDALQCATPPTFSTKLVEDWQKAVETLRARLSTPKPEPVACPFPCGWKTMLSIIIKDGAFLARGLIEGETVTGHQREIVMRLIDYAKTMALHGMTATQREWQRLTDEEVVQLLGGVRERLDGDVFGGFARAIEAKLKEKNT